jgi:hypothetical protein
MPDNFKIYEPNKFYIEFVRRGFDEFMASPSDAYRVKMAITNADIMAERMWNYFHVREPRKIGYTKSPREYRDFLVKNECCDFQLVWDVHDGHKHVQLSRSNRQVTSADQTGVRYHGGLFDGSTFDAATFDSAWSEYIVTLDNGQERSLSDVLKNVIEMWERLLAKS